ncbi:MAG: hypothetical protein KatS3mg105_3030 [Gemmatales bacterium]|nr:MAG: hypothetical protein KatS3mg105_3030 [Gemmatales bacterium]
MEYKAYENFVINLSRSNLIERGQLEQIVEEFLRDNSDPSPPELAQYLVRNGLLTPFQAEHLLVEKPQELVLNQYVLMDVLGTGSMGTVYKAISKLDNQDYAVKLLPRRSMWNVRIARRIVRAFANIKHPAVVPFVDVGTAGGSHYLVWSYVEGEPLDKVVQRVGKLFPGVAALYGAQIAEGLSVCHAQKLVHGLIKPSNILITSEQKVLLLDFGIGTLISESEEESLIDTMSTANTVTTGLDCKSPESIINPMVRTPEGDQYSLGCVLYFCLTGRFPFEGSPVQKMMAHQSQEPIPVRELCPQAPPALADIIARLMKKEPGERYPNIDRVASELRKLAVNEDVAVRLLAEPVKQESPQPRSAPRRRAETMKPQPAPKPASSPTPALVSAPANPPTPSAPATTSPPDQPRPPVQTAPRATTPAAPTPPAQTAPKPTTPTPPPATPSTSPPAAVAQTPPPQTPPKPAAAPTPPPASSPTPPVPATSSPPPQPRPPVQTTPRATTPAAPTPPAQTAPKPTTPTPPPATPSTSPPAAVAQTPPPQTTPKPAAAPAPPPASPPTPPVPAASSPLPQPRPPVQTTPRATTPTAPTPPVQTAPKATTPTPPPATPSTSPPAAVAQTPPPQTPPKPAAAPTPPPASPPTPPVPATSSPPPQPRPPVQTTPRATTPTAPTPPVQTAPKPTTPTPPPATPSTSPPAALAQTPPSQTTPKPAAAPAPPPASPPTPPVPAASSPPPVQAAPRATTPAAPTPPAQTAPKPTTPTPPPATPSTSPPAALAQTPPPQTTPKPQAPPAPAAPATPSKRPATVPVISAPPAADLPMGEHADVGSDSPAGSVAPVGLAAAASSPQTATKWQASGAVTTPASPKPKSTPAVEMPAAVQLKKPRPAPVLPNKPRSKPEVSIPSSPTETPPAEQTPPAPPYADTNETVAERRLERGLASQQYVDRMRRLDDEAAGLYEEVETDVVEEAQAEAEQYEEYGGEEQAGWPEGLVPASGEVNLSSLESTPSLPFTRQSPRTTSLKSVIVVGLVCFLAGVGVGLGLAHWVLK